MPSFDSLSLELGVSVRREQQHLQGLTVEARRLGYSFSLDPVEDYSAALRILRSSKPLKDVESTVTFAHPELFALFREEAGREEYGGFCSIEPLVCAQQESEFDQRLCLLHPVTKPFVNLQSFFSQPYPFLWKDRLQMRVG